MLESYERWQGIAAYFSVIFLIIALILLVVNMVTSMRTIGCAPAIIFIMSILSSALSLHFGRKSDKERERTE